MAITVQLIRAEQAMSILLHLCPVSGWPVTRIDRPHHDTRAMTAYKPKLERQIIMKRIREKTVKKKN